MTPQAPLPTQALVIGAGPVGLFQVFQLGLLGLHAEVVDTLPRTVTGKVQKGRLRGAERRRVQGDLL